MELQWKANVNLSTYHTAWCLTHHAELAGQCPAELKQAAEEIDALCSAFRVPRQRFWDQLLTLSPNVNFSNDLAQRLMQRMGLSGSSTRTRLASELQRCRREFEAAYPKYTDEAMLRAGPLRELWLATGPGMLLLMGRMTEASLVVDHAEVVVVQPVIGGMGYAHLTTNRLHMEGLLANADARLPETMRLTWLLAQLDFERPVYSELINANRLRALAGLAMLPAVLTASAELDLGTYTLDRLEHVIHSWHLDTLGLPVGAAAQITLSWWETYQAARPDWRTALTGLDQLLSM